MSASITHQLVAERVFNLLGNKEKHFITDLGAYYIGAQGGDPFFLYKPLVFSKNNIGKKLHRENPTQFFSHVKKGFFELDGIGKSFYLGYVTHYATDTVFHPYIYGLERYLKQHGFNRKRDNLHFQIEKDIDGFLYSEYYGLPVKNYTLPYFPNQSVANGVYRALDKVVFELYGVKLSANETYKTLKRFFNHQKFLSDGKGVRRGVVRTVETLLFLPRTLSGFFSRSNPNLLYTNFNNKITPYSPNGESVFDLFEKSVKKSALLIAEFLADGDTLNGFTENFNAGKIVKKKT